MQTFQKDHLTVEIYESRTLMGQAAAKDIKQQILTLSEQKAQINMIFAAAPSQNEVLQALVEDRDIPWDRINAFHMDEYIGLPQDAPQGFGNFLKTHIFGFIPFKQIHYIDITATDPVKEAERYANLLSQNPPDIVVMGIGENGHIAFNDPGFADFQDPLLVKPVKLDAVCRQQQVNDGCFALLSDVPEYALTLTVPALMSAPWLFCIVPARSKALAVRQTLLGPVTDQVPATILRLQTNAALYLEKESASLL